LTVRIANARPKAGEMRTRYLTDGVHLYEIADQRAVQNFGLRRGMINYTIIREVVSEAVARIDGLHLAALSEVQIDGSNLL
jgi:hypothetical protein